MPSTLPQVRQPSPSPSAAVGAAAAGAAARPPPTEITSLMPALLPPPPVAGEGASARARLAESPPRAAPLRLPRAVLRGATAALLATICSTSGMSACVMVRRYLLR